MGFVCVRHIWICFSVMLHCSAISKTVNVLARFFNFFKSSMMFCSKNCHCPAVHCQASIKMHCTSSVLVLCLHQPRIRIPEILSRVSHSCYICSRCLWLSPFNCLRAPFPVNPCQVSPDYRKSSLLPRTCYVCVCVQDTETLCAS